MKIQITQGCAGVDFGYGNGKVLTVDVDLPKSRALMLLNAGLAVPVTERVETADYPRHVGGGWYQTADGQKVRKADLEV